MKIFFAIIVFTFVSINSFSQQAIDASKESPKVLSGTIKHFEKFPSKWVDPRNVDVWLPDGYGSKHGYPVLYMHDGQMLFDSTINWNKLEWGVDEMAKKLISEKKLPPFIVVAVWNTTKRHNEYLPQQLFETLTILQQASILAAKRTSGYAVFAKDKIRSDDYLKFLVTELKPFIDKNFSVKSDQANTFIAGSSMGGLISLYALCEYPLVFGGAACLSTHWPVIFTMDNNPVPAAIFNYLGNHLPDPANHKIYFDFGTATLDTLYAPLQIKVDEMMKAKGYTAKNWITREFIGADHSEISWSKRLDIPLLFLFGP